MAEDRICEGRAPSHCGLLAPDPRVDIGDLKSLEPTEIVLDVVSGSRIDAVHPDRDAHKALAAKNRVADGHQR